MELAHLTVCKCCCVFYSERTKVRWGSLQRKCCRFLCLQEHLCHFSCGVTLSCWDKRAEFINCHSSPLTSARAAKVNCSILRQHQHLLLTAVHVKSITQPCYLCFLAEIKCQLVSKVEHSSNVSVISSYCVFQEKKKEGVTKMCNLDLSKKLKAAAFPSQGWVNKMKIFDIH